MIERIKVEDEIFDIRKLTKMCLNLKDIKFPEICYEPKSFIFLIKILHAQHYSSKATITFYIKAKKINIIFN